jgi:hypothetical protein
MCDAAFASGDRTAKSISSVRVLFNATPFAEVQTHAEQTNGVRPNVRAAGQAELTYQSDTRFVDGLAPPFIPGQLPLRISAPWAMNDFGTEGVSATIRLSIFDSDGAEFFDDTQVLSSGEEGGEYVLFGAPEPHEPFTITIESTCSSVAPDDGESTCLAVIDPLIEFDQATFDATHGANSYVLSQYWEIGQSDNLFPVPVPMIGFVGRTLCVLLLVTSAMKAARRRQSQTSIEIGGT